MSDYWDPFWSRPGAGALTPATIAREIADLKRAEYLVKPETIMVSPAIKKRWDAGECFCGTEIGSYLGCPAHRKRTVYR